MPLSSPPADNVVVSLSEYKDEKSVAAALCAVP